jgi:subtilisin family serine protease
MRSLETKESSRLMTGNTILAYLDAKKASPTGKAGDEAFDTAFEKSLSQRVGSLPWDKVAEDVKAARGRAQFLTRDLVIGGIKSQLDPVVAENNNTLTSDLANGMVNARVMVDKMLPLQPLIDRTYTKLIAEKEANVQRVDIWSPSIYNFAEGEKGSPVVIGIWDSGVDTSVFSQDQLWTNTKETVNGKDDDANGFVDDVHGIAYDLVSEKTIAVLHPADELVMSYSDGVKMLKGWSDLTSAVDSEDAAKVRKHIASLPADKVGEFTEDLGLMGNISHGTHVAGIAAEGNPFARLLAARLTFDFRNVPQHAPTIELAQATAKMYQETVDYFRSSGVRVVNMSWGGDMKSVESELERKGVGKTPEERQQLAQRIFTIAADGLEKAMLSAPEILFIAAAGNSDNDNAFAQFIPSGLNVPNMLTIGAIDETGKPTGFTTFGKNVTLYANGFEVESFVPGGSRVPFSGTSMAAPQLANLVGKILAVKPELKPAQLIELVRSGAVPMEGYEGRFIIHQKRTMEKAKAMK